MAITRYAGDRFTIGAGETKPTGVLDGAVLIDTGNLELYIKRNGAWVEVTGAGGGNLIATGAIVDEISGNLIITGQTLQTQITSNDSDISTLDSTTVKLTTNQSIAGNKIFTNDVTINNLTVTGTETIINVENLAIKDNIIEINSGESGAGISKISGGIVIDRGTATNANILYNDTNDRFELNFPLAVEGEVVATASNLITTGQTLQTQIISNDSDISTLTTNLGTTGQTLQTQIISNDSDISTLTTNLGTTGQTLQTQITSNDSDISTLTSNLVTTGQTLQTQITNNDSDISTLTSNLVTTGQTLTTNINTVSSNLVSTGAVVDDISGNLITTGQTLQTQITSNDSDIATLTSNLVTTGQTVTDNLIATGAIVDDISGNLITTGQTLTNEIANVSGLVTTGTLNGSGVTNYVARWVDGNTLTSGVLVDNGTNVGINVPSPNYPLEISSSDNATIRIEDTTNASKLDLRAEDSAVLIRSTSNFPMKFDVNQTERMRIDTAGNVGIGTNDPLGKLVVKAAIPTVYAGVTPDISSSLISIANLQASETTNDQAQLQFNVTGGSYNRVGSIGLIAESASNRKGALVFTTDDAGTRTEKMRIAGDGNVGIGVADPKQTVHIGKSASNALGPVLMLDNTAGGSNDSSAIIFASGGDTYQRAKIVSTVEGASAYLGNLGFYTGRSDTTGVTEKMRIAGDGNVGIGTSTANYKLHVVGTGHVTSTFSVGNLGATGGMTVTPGGQTDVYALKVARSGSATSVDIWDAGSDSVVIGATSSEKTLTVKSGSKVGIDKVAPSTTLHVGGKVTIDTVDTDTALTDYLVIDGNGEIHKRTTSGGSQGSQGATGSGNQGIQGRQGITGQTGVYAQGTIGSQGTRGTQGIHGLQGVAGSQGNSGSGSDYRIKENIKKFKDGYQMVKGINSYTFNYKQDIKTNDSSLIPNYNRHIKEEIGFIAHEIQDTAQKIRGAAEFKPVEGVKDQIDSNQGSPVYQKIHYEKITPILWGALKDTIEKVEQLEARVKELENGANN